MSAVLDYPVSFNRFARPEQHNLDVDGVARLVGSKYKNQWGATPVTDVYGGHGQTFKRQNLGSAYGFNGGGGSWEMDSGKIGIPFMATGQLVGKNTTTQPYFLNNFVQEILEHQRYEAQRPAPPALHHPEIPNLQHFYRHEQKPVPLNLLQTNCQDGQENNCKLKPRDPRKILHIKTVLNKDNSVPEQLKINGTPEVDSRPSKDTFRVRDEKTNTEVLSESAAKSEGVPQASPTDPLWEDFDHLFEGYDNQQKAAIRTERAKRMAEQRDMFANKKLSLVLDLDHTLLNSAMFNEVEPPYENMLRTREQEEQGKPRRYLYRLPHIGMWTKLRPGIWSFLEKASKLYELHICTMGTKAYAKEMAKLLDPKGVLFGDRVISKHDEEMVHNCKDLDGVLGMESAVVIIDDTPKVWPHNKPNLIHIERYHFFPSSRRQFGLSGPSLLEIGHDERLEDGTLAATTKLIETLHQKFFSNPSLYEVDVRNILAAEQQKILGGCRILFSRIFPVGEATPQQHPLWQTATRLGAVCTTQIDQLVTHVVANSPGTDKVNWAMANGRFVVNPGWVEASAFLFRRAKENDFSIRKRQSMAVRENDGVSVEPYKDLPHFLKVVLYSGAPVTG